MSLLDAIHKWSLTLQPWKSDALRRLILKQVLTSSDYDDIFAMLKSSRGIPDPEKRLTSPLSEKDIPQTVSVAQKATLLSLKKLKHVNRIAPNQALNFCPNGMTIIYGDNGAGKSGYSRVLKRACKARDLTDEVLPNAFEAFTPDQVPEAFFDIDVGGIKSSVKWTTKDSPPKELDSICVFDSKCARAYLDDEQDVAYMPYGLDAVENLARVVLPELQNRIEKEITLNSVDLSMFSDLSIGDTVVSQTVKNLSFQTKVELIKELANFTSENASRLNSLAKALSEGDTQQKITQLKRTKHRVSDLIKKVLQCLARVSDEEVIKYCKIDEEAEVAFRAEAVAIQQFQSGDALLSGTGGDEWKQLFVSARAFAKIAYPNLDFPPDCDGVKCVLCQQELTHGTERLRRFEAFILQDATKVADSKRVQRKRSFEQLKGAVVVFDMDAALIDEIGSLNPALASLLSECESQLKKRKQDVLNAFESHSWGRITALTASPIELLETAESAIEAEIVTYQGATDDEQRKALTAEMNELKARQSLSKRVDSVVAAINRLKHIEKLRACQDDCKTRAISEKSKELSEKAVTEALQSALNQEFAALGAAHLKVKLSARNSQGKTLHKLVLDLPKTKKLPQVLSEGELRAIAIGSFLAELNTSGHMGAAVFDDPVSSLDHLRRQKVAHRLVTEAKKRQIIIFTHDTVFLGELREFIEDMKVEHSIQHLSSILTGNSGFCEEGLPWHHQGYKQRLDHLKKSQSSLEKKWNSLKNTEQSEEVARFYSIFRATLEKVVEEVALKGVVGRFRNYIRIDNLKKVVGFPESEYKEISKLFQRACDITNAHDPSSGRGSILIEPADIRSDVEKLEKLVDEIQRRQSNNASNPP